MAEWLGLIAPLIDTYRAATDIIIVRLCCDENLLFGGAYRRLHLRPEFISLPLPWIQKKKRKKKREKRKPDEGVLAYFLLSCHILSWVSSIITSFCRPIR